MKVRRVHEGVGVSSVLMGGCGTFVREMEIARGEGINDSNSLLSISGDADWFKDAPLKIAVSARHSRCMGPAYAALRTTMGKTTSYRFVL